ncbi:Protein argonaute-2 [Hypsizygus marmoreus]|uniref:Protein argonaute-2 n=1 Tax=Hypsizygus marmoreus TaxID=39966 RepID=A0A369JFQ1_HYPMA|nr:Protein argonaute-2 [Hypsizygus marmoreus]
MPPRIAPDRGSHRAARGARGGRGGAGRGGTNIGLRSTGATSTIVGEHITTVGVRRPNYGTAGRPLAVFTNNFPTSIPNEIIRHYDAIIPSTLPSRLNNELIKKLQAEVAVDIFSPKAVYDGRKNMFTTRELQLGPSHSREFDVTLAPVGASQGDRPAKIYKIKITKVAEINPEVLERFVRGEQSQDNQVLTAITALNVAIRMEPNEKYPFNVRSFFTNSETKNLGGGLELWRGYFQSVRPGMGRMLINVDISTGLMYKSGPLINLCLDFFDKRDANILSPVRGLPDRERLRLQRFLAGVRVSTPPTSPGQPPRIRVIKKLSTAGADASTFTLRGGGGSMTVANYFRSQANSPLHYPHLLCVEVGSGALIPLEICTVPPGQIMRKQVPPEKTKAVVEFATKKPAERLASIRQGIQVLSYGQSDYVRQFGMNVETAAGPLQIQARVLTPPTLKYGAGSKQPTIVPRDGSWNMMDKKLFKPMTIQKWVIVCFEGENRFPLPAAREMVRGLIAGCRSVGMTVQEETPLIKHENPQRNVGLSLRAAGEACMKQWNVLPNLVVVVLPDLGNADIYTAVKHFGDVTAGVATQCLKAGKCRGAKIQYWANVCLKMNVKLGGINLIPDPASVAVLTDPNNPTIVMGADVIHPAPGSIGRPSFTAVVGNVDSDTAKYIAKTGIQTSRQEMIDDLQAMCLEILKMYMDYRTNAEKKRNAAPTRLIFYRDGVSEGQFQQVLDIELPMIKAACAELKIKPKITLIVVGKRHHVRFFPQGPGQADRSGNCPAGTVVDREIGHPVEYDFYLQSHGGLLGTSRPAHYSVLYDDNGFNADPMQALSFALCHVYARATRSVSIPAPVYYADIVCSRAKNHYAPGGDLDFSESATQTEDHAAATLQAFKAAYKPINPRMAKMMYFS